MYRYLSGLLKDVVKICRLEELLNSDNNSSRNVETEGLKSIKLSDMFCGWPQFVTGEI